MTSGRTRRDDSREAISWNGLDSGYGGGTTDILLDPNLDLPSLLFNISSSIANSTSRSARTDSVLKIVTSSSTRDGRLLGPAWPLGERSERLGDNGETAEF